MALIDFTSYEAVRAALGVSVDEISDVTLALDLYDFNLQVELDSINTTLSSVYLAAKVNPTPTDQEKRLVRSTSLFATYCVAKHLTTSLPLFSPKDISDSKASFARYTSDPYKEVIAGVLSLYQKFIEQVKADFASLNQTTVTSTRRTFMLVSSPSSDPVTGT